MLKLGSFNWGALYCLFALLSAWTGGVRGVWRFYYLWSSNLEMAGLLQLGEDRHSSLRSLHENPSFELLTQNYLVQLLRPNERYEKRPSSDSTSSAVYTVHSRMPSRHPEFEMTMQLDAIDARIALSYAVRREEMHVLHLAPRDDDRCQSPLTEGKILA